MKITSRGFGRKGEAYSIIELTIENYNTTMTVDVCDLEGKVDISLINSLKEIVEELEEQNKLIDEYDKERGVL